MSTILIDNAILTSVQRLLGEIEIPSRDTIDGDIAALENLIIAILFSNTIICLDDYKKEFKEQRKKKFSFIRLIDIEDLQIDSLSKFATKEALKFKPTISGGKFSDPAFEEFFELLKLNIVCTWDITSSIYYLTLKMLGKEDTEDFDKYSQLAASIFSELRDATSSRNFVQSQVDLFDRNGRKIDQNYKIQNAKWNDGSTGGLTPGLNAFIASLNWIARRSIYFTTLAKELKANCMLHPIRQSFQFHYLSKKMIYDRQIRNEFIKKFKLDTEALISEKIKYGYSGIVSFSLPLFSAFIASKTKSIYSIIDYANELRDNSKFIEAREILSEIDNLMELEESDKVHKKLVKVQKSLTLVFNEFRRKYQIPITQSDIISNVFQIYGSLSSWKSAPPAPDFIKNSKIWNLYSLTKERKSFSAIFRNLSNELSNISKLGKIHDILTKEVKIKKGAAQFNPKVEEPRWEGHHSNFKSPM